MDIGIRADGLTTRDFEDFAIELVKRRFNNDSLHGFPEGRDDGIDGIDDIISPTLLVQAKRWQINKNSKAAVNLLKKEIDKIVETKEKYNWTSPFNYVVVTSMRLSPANLKTIRDYAEEKLPGALTSDNHIIFSSTLTTLSQDQSYKDLFTEYGLIEKEMSGVLRNDRLDAIEAESRDYFADTDVKYFVETALLGEAYHILQKEHILLVQGPPGIGKTTTCSMLGHLFLNNQENQIDVIVRRVEEINDVITLYNQTYRDTEDRGLLVIFDDFLGRNTFDVGERILQDVRRLYSASVHSNKLFICLNSRTQILKDATGKNSEFEQLIDDKFTEQRNIMIDLSSYSDLDKARIFRRTVEKHLATLTPDKRQLLVKSYNSLREQDWTIIIRHRNYFPRLIDLIVKNFLEASDGFYQHVLSNLDNPTRLYDELFARLADEEKCLLFSLWHFKELPIPEEWLRNAFQALKLYPTFELGQALKKLDGSWLRFIREGTVTKVDFLNPSIVDFLDNKYKEFPQLLEQIDQSSVYLSQIYRTISPLMDIARDTEQKNRHCYELLLQDWDRFYDKYLFVVEKLLAIIELDRYSDCRDECLSLMDSYDGRVPFVSGNGWVYVVYKILNSRDMKLKKDFLQKLNCSEFVERCFYLADVFDERHTDLELLSASIAFLIEDVSTYSLEITDAYLPTSFANLTHYQLFRDAKIKLLQNYLDNEAIFELEKDEFYTVPASFDLEVEVVTQLDKFSDKINKILTKYYTRGDRKVKLWKDLDASMFDYSNLQQHLEEFLQGKSYYRPYVEDDDSWQEKESLEASWEDINALLNTPLS